MRVGYYSYRASDVGVSAYTVRTKSKLLHSTLDLITASRHMFPQESCTS